MDDELRLLSDRKTVRKHGAVSRRITTPTECSTLVEIQL